MESRMEWSCNSEVDWMGLLLRCTSGKSLSIVVVLMSCHQPSHERNDTHCAPS